MNGVKGVNFYLTASLGDIIREDGLAGPNGYEQPRHTKGKERNMGQ